MQTKANQKTEDIPDTQDTLRGEPFIAYNHDDGLGEKGTPRVCGCCFYGFQEDTKTGKEIIGDCHIQTTPHPRKLFNCEESKMPPEIDEKKVGNYCPHWLPFYID